ncbi:endonuclease/exonuclease/phosphatase family protein [Tabrizicola sp.]|uniref:endonuclease/exonuclease/phosphatase family protein n=1 Tax=Tabrizicola sp. TaxID=2005166 RepID=UPI00286ABEB4|nr:endonuclease/exonuclease/phosphatase family protein [Tabrizicola sp.]
MAPKTVSFTTFNLYNLNEPGLPVYSDTGGWTQVEYDLKIAWTARMLQEMRADVIGFQEVWHAASIDAALKASGLDASHVALVPEGHAGQMIVCGAAVDRSILVGEPRWIAFFPEEFILKSRGDDPQAGDVEVNIRRFSRPVLHFQIKPHSKAPVVSVYVCHFKSKGPTAIFREPWYVKATHQPHTEAIGGALSTIRRTAEAMALRMMVTKEMKGTDTPVVVLGDCNDGQHSNTLNIMTGQPRFLTALSEGGGDTDLYTAQTLQQYRSQTDVYYTHIFNDTRESLDHILISQEFYDNSKKRIWAFDGLTIANDHLNEDAHKETGSGDHGVVRARFKYMPAKAILS